MFDSSTRQRSRCSLDLEWKFEVENVVCPLVNYGRTTWCTIMWGLLLPFILKEGPRTFSCERLFFFSEIITYEAVS